MRRKWTLIATRELLEKRKTFDGTVGEYCRSVGIAPSMYYRLRKQHHNAGHNRRPAKIVQLLAGSSVTPSNFLEVFFPNGSKLKIHGPDCLTRLNEIISFLQEQS